MESKHVLRKTLCHHKSKTDTDIIYLIVSNIFDISNSISNTQFQTAIDSDDLDEISCDEDAIPLNNGTKTVTISMESYERLLKASVDVYKANDAIKSKNDRIEQLEKEIFTLKRSSKNTELLSTVSRYNRFNKIFNYIILFLFCNIRHSEKY